MRIAISAISANSASVGDVLPESRINNLPIVGNNVLSLLNVLPGLRVSLGGTQLNTIGGLGLNTMNITRDGLTSNDTRFGPEGDLSANTTLPNFGGLGVMSPTTINPDLVGEIRLILSPVDAELGRGNSQIQITTRSGTNKYTGSAVWNIQNTALNANTWGNNRQCRSANRRMGSDHAGLEKRQPVHRQLRWTDHSKQDVLLCVVGSEHLRSAIDTESSRSDKRGPKRNCPILGRMDQR